MLKTWQAETKVLASRNHPTGLLLRKSGLTLKLLSIDYHCLVGAKYPTQSLAIGVEVQEVVCSYE